MNNVSMLNNFATALVLSLVFVSPGIQAADTHADKKDAARIHVVFQVSDDDAKKWNLTLNNVKNIQQEVGADNADVEVVAYGPGINMLRFESTVTERVDEAIKAGVAIVACENTMRSQKLGKSDMISNIGYVPAGVIEIIKKQNAGYAYIRP